MARGNFNRGINPAKLLTEKSLVRGQSCDLPGFFCTVAQPSSPSFLSSAFFVIDSNERVREH
jgi:hypothetical protein